MRYPAAALLTLGIELAVVVPIASRSGARRRRAALGVLAANAVTHPLLWLLLCSDAGRRIGWAGIGGLEAAVVAIEAPIVAWSWRRSDLRVDAALAALLANAASFLIGLLVTLA